MMQYKTVAGPIGLTISKNDSYAQAVGQYAAIIQQEAVDGWELLFIQEIPVTKDKGCAAGCGAALGLGSQYEQVPFKMLVFGRRVG